MDFLESPRFPDAISYGAVFGPEFRTELIQLGSGFEQANKEWPSPLHRGDVAHNLKTEAEFEEVRAFFLVAGGKFGRFRFKDWSDYKATTATGRLGAGAVGTGVPSYQLIKRYAVGANYYDRTIKKPVAGTVKVFKGGVEQATGWSIDTTSGVVTFSPTASVAISGISRTNPAVVDTPAAHNLTSGTKVYVSGVSGMTQVNGLVFTIGVLTPTTFTIDCNAINYGTYTSGGTAGVYPQSTDTLTWSGEFDVPVRFDTDAMPVSVDGPDRLNWDSIPIVEVRLP